MFREYRQLYTRDLLIHCKHVKTRFDTSNKELDKSLRKGKSKKIIRLIKDDLGGKIITEFATLRPKT